MSFCSYFNQGICKSCTLINIPYEQQIKDKEAQLESTLSIKLDPTITSSIQNFRDKIKLAVAGDLSHPVIGLAQLDGSKEILSCPIHSQALNDVIPSLVEFIKKWKLTPYSIQERRGELKGIILSHSPQTGEKLLRFILRSKEALDRIKLGLKELDGFKVISVNIQPIHQAILEGPEEIILTSHHYIEHRFSHLSILYGPQSFMQTNLSVAHKLYAQSKQWIDPLPIKKVADLFCGSGPFALHLATKDREVIGFEISSEASRLAQLAALHQNISATFHASATEHIFQDLTDFTPDLVVVNPPRRGLGLSLNPLLNLSPTYLLYSSCSPESLASDLELLKTRYKILRGQLFDLFPHTNHFETLVLMKLAQGQK